MAKRGFLITAISVTLVFAWYLTGWAARDNEARDIATKIRCPVCANLSIADSPSDMARQMRVVIGEKLAQGQNQEQILAYFVSRYGEWILLEPKKKGINLLLWILPFLGVGGAGLFAYLFLRRLPAPPAKPGKEPDPGDLSRVDKDLKDFKY